MPAEFTDKPTMFAPAAIDAGVARCKAEYEALRDAHPHDEYRQLYYDLCAQLAPAVTRWILTNAGTEVAKLCDVAEPGMAMVALMMANNFFTPPAVVQGAQSILHQALTRAAQMHEQNASSGSIMGHEVQGHA